MSCVFYKVTGKSLAEWLEQREEWMRERRLTNCLGLSGIQGPTRLRKEPRCGRLTVKRFGNVLVATEGRFNQGQLASCGGLFKSFLFLRLRLILKAIDR